MTGNVSLGILWTLAMSFLGCLSEARLLHIVLIMADDLGWNDVSFHGSDQIPTPNLDHLAADGVVLHRYYTHPMCTPSRAALMTGLYSSRIGMQHYVIKRQEPWGLPLDLTLMPQHLKKLGYVTHLIGKWHLGYHRKEYTPTFRGFDSHFGSWGGALDYYNHGFLTLDNVWGLDMRRNMTVVSGTCGTYLTDLLTSEASDVIRNHDPSQPLFLFLSHSAPHIGCHVNPLQAPTDRIDRMGHIADVRRRLYAAMVTGLDESIGRIFEALHRRLMLQDTLLVFVSDNGAWFPGQWNGSGSNWPLRGMKDTLFEGGLRVPAVVWSPLVGKAGSVSAETVHVTDWLPTLYGLAGGRVDDLGSLDGMDISQTVLRGLPSGRSETVHRIDPSDNSGSLTVGDYKFVYGPQADGLWNGWYGPSGREEPASAKPDDTCAVARVLKEMNRNWKIGEDWKRSLTLHCRGRDVASEPCVPEESPCLFDIREDPCEQNNLAKERPEILKMCRDKVQDYSSWVVYPLNAPADSAALPVHHGHVWTTWRDMAEDQTCQRDSCLSRE